MVVSNHRVLKIPSSGKWSNLTHIFQLGGRSHQLFSHPGFSQISADQLPWFDPTDVARMWGTQLRLVMSIQCRHPPLSVGLVVLGCDFVAGCDWIHVCWIYVCIYICYGYDVIMYYAMILHYCMCYMMQWFAWWHSWCFASVSISLKMWKLRVCVCSLLYIAFPQTFSDSQKG